MKISLSNFAKPLVVSAALLFAINPARAQPGGGGGGQGGPHFSGALVKLFGDNAAFTASVRVEADGASIGQAMTMDSTMSLLDGMTRFDMDMSKMHGPNIPPQAVEQMKQLGLDKVVTVSVPDKKVARLIYPTIKAYAETPISESDAAKAADFKMEVKESGSETVEGHDCVKNKVVVTGTDGVAHESTVWNAKDLNNFPVKIQMTEHGTQMTMTFKDVKLQKPDASLFNPPSDFKKYDSMMSLMMSRMNAGGAAGSMGAPGSQ
jgi:hypothetical protein